jgi:replicative DNA helicase
MSDNEFSRLFEGAQRLGELDLYIDDTPGLSMAEIRSRARTFVQHHGKCRIFIDYLQFVSRSKAPTSAGFQGKDEKSHVSEVSRAMKNLARELKCPVIALSQLSRDLEKRTNKRPMMSDLRESGAIEQDADIIIFLYRDVVYNPDTPDPNAAEWIVAKQRDGEIGTAMTHFEKNYQLFV